MYNVQSYPEFNTTCEFTTAAGAQLPNEFTPEKSASANTAARKNIASRLKTTLKYAAFAGTGTAGLAALLKWV